MLRSRVPAHSLLDVLLVLLSKSQTAEVAIGVKPLRHNVLQQIDDLKMREKEFQTANIRPPKGGLLTRLLVEAML